MARPNKGPAHSTRSLRERWLAGRGTEEAVSSSIGCDDEDAVAEKRAIPSLHGAGGGIEQQQKQRQQEQRLQKQRQRQQEEEEGGGGHEAADAGAAAAICDGPRDQERMGSEQVDYDEI